MIAARGIPGRIAKARSHSRDGDDMSILLDAINRGSDAIARDPRFRFAPEGWTLDAARDLARQEGLDLGEDHLALISALQEFFARHAHLPALNMRELHDALEEKFHHKGGLKYLYSIMPGGPVAQGCRFAGLKAPPGAYDLGFGSAS